jgi:hypothetical protein
VRILKKRESQNNRSTDPPRCRTPTLGTNGVRCARLTAAVGVCNIIRSSPAEKASFWLAHGGVSAIAGEIEEICGDAFSACGIVRGTELVGLEQLLERGSLEQLLERGSR